MLSAALDPEETDPMAVLTTYTKTVALVADDIAAMEGPDGYTLVKQCGTAKVLIPQLLVAVFTPGDTPYSFSDNSQDGATFQLIDGPGSYTTIRDLALGLTIGKPGQNVTTWVLDETVDQHAWAANTGLRLSGDLGEAPAEGDGELRVTIRYAYISLPV